MSARPGSAARDTPHTQVRIELDSVRPEHAARLLTLLTTGDRVEFYVGHSGGELRYTLTLLGEDGDGVPLVRAEELLGAWRRGDSGPTRGRS